MSEGGLARPAGPFSAWEIGLALRYLRAKRREGGITLIAIISFVGIMLAVAGLIGTMSIMNGFRTDLLSRIVGFNGHIYVQGPPIEHAGRDALLTLLRHIPGVVQVAPLSENQALAQAPGGQQGALVRGITRQTLLETPLVANNTDPKSAVSTFGQGEFGGDQVLVGARLADMLGVKPGDSVSIVSPSGGVTAMGQLPTMKSYTVAGTFQIGMAEYDQAFIFMPLEQAQLLFGKEGQWDVVEIKTTDPDHLDKVKAAVAAVAGPSARVTDWRDRNQSFFNALQVERWAMRIILGIVVLIAALNIISGIVMLVKNKGRDIAILRTIGAGQGAVLRIFFMAGALIGVAGTAAGVTLGVLFCVFIQQIQDFLEWATGTKLFAADIYFLSHIPARVDWLEVLLVILWSVGAACMASIIPAWNASRIDPVEALRYE